MEYQSFFMLLKSFSVENGIFCSNNPLMAQGFVQIKKEQQNYSTTIQINNFVADTFAFLVCETNIAKIKLNGATTKAQVSFNITDAVCVFIEDYNLFACKNGTIGCQQAYKRIERAKEQKAGKSTLEKIFGTVYDTYFFDCIKPKLASLFAMGKPFASLNNTFADSKWVSVSLNGEEKLFGIIYKDKFAHMIAMGSDKEFKQVEYAKTYKIDGKIYNILFLSASNGKIISF